MNMKATAGMLPAQADLSAQIFTNNTFHFIA